MCTVHESKNIYIFYSSHRLKNHFFLSLSLSHSVPLSLSQITQLSFTLPNHSQSVPLFLSQITPPLPNHPSSSSHPLDPAVPRPQITHRRSSLTITLSLSSLTPLLTGFDCEIGLTGFDCFMVVLRWGFVVCGGATTVVDSWWS